MIYPSFNTHTLPLVSSAAGLVEIEEGELTGQQLSLQSLQLARTSFAKEPYVKQVKLIPSLQDALTELQK